SQLSRNIVWILQFSPDGKTLDSGSYDNTVRIWDASQWVTFHYMKLYTSIVWSVNFSPDGKTLASGSSDNTVRIWDASQGVTLKELERQTGELNEVKFLLTRTHSSLVSRDNERRIGNVY